MLTAEEFCPNCDREVVKIEKILQETLPDSNHDPNKTYKDSGMRLYYHFDETICGKDENGNFRFVKVR